MTWSLSAHGFLGDVTASENLYHKIREVLSDATSGTMGSAFSAPGVSAENFHLALQDDDAAASPQVTAPTEQGAVDSDTAEPAELSQPSGEPPVTVPAQEATPQD